MTHDILQSDIELAIRLRDERRPDEEIVRVLARRGVDPEKAASLLDDLQNGRKANARATLPSEFALRRRKRVEHPQPSAASPTMPPAQEPRLRRGPPRPKGFQRVRWLVLGLVLVPLAILLLVLGAKLVERRSAASRATAEPPPAASQKQARPRQLAGTASVVAPALELQPDGLRIGGRLVERAGLLAAVVAALGAPSRTNHLAETGATVYAFDQVGVLVYVYSHGRTNSLMLDCDATGGAHGTAMPFAGTLKIGEEIIGPDTDPQALARLKPLGLSSVRGDGSIWGGRYGGLELVFAYLKTPQRLSLVEIDL